MSDAAEQIWNRAKTIGTCMLVTINGSSLRARPMSAIVDKDEEVIRFIADRNDYKDNEIIENPAVCLTFASHSDGSYVSMTGEASIETRIEQLRKHWVEAADAWFEKGPEDPRAIMIEVRPQRGEYWSAPGTISQAIEFVRANIEDRRPDLGENKSAILQ